MASENSYFTGYPPSSFNENAKKILKAFAITAIGCGFLYALYSANNDEITSINKGQTPPPPPSNYMVR